MKLRLFVGFVFLAAFSASAEAACLAAGGGAPPVQLTGKLAHQVFPGRPNYESIENGDEAEYAFILQLDSAICIYDKEGLGPGPSVHFNKVHLYSRNEFINETLSKLAGNRVAVSGEAFGAHTGHHHAPLVVEVTKVSALEHEI